MSGDDGIDIVLAAIVHRATGKSVSQMSAAEADMTLAMARDIYALVEAFTGERIAQAIEASSQCSCRDAYCAERAAAKRHARIARNSP